MRLSELIHDIKIMENIDEEAIKNVDILSLSTDSRKKTPNALFFCLSGGRTDSHAYAAQAVKNGAIAVLAERRIEDISVPQILVKNSRKALAEISATFHGNPSQRLKVIGITGTNGKTTTTHMLAAILKNAGKNVGIIGTLGVSFLNQTRNSDLTTPDPIELQRTLAEMWLYGVEYVVMEVSAHALFYHKVSGMHFAACIFTNLTQDHLDFFSSMQTYKEAKMRLFGEEYCSFAVLNGDDETGREIAQMRANCLLSNSGKTLFYGLNTPTDAFALVTEESLEGSECMLNINDNLCRVHLRLLGRHNVYNALAAATCAMELGVSAEEVSNGLNGLENVSGRLQKVGEINGGKIYIDFAHTPDGLKKSLDSLRPYCDGRLLCLFGCGGNRDKKKRPIMGEIAGKYSDFSILTSDNPRYEDPLDIISDIERGYRRFSVKYVVVPDRKKALEYAIDFLSKGDILLVAGKGAEEYQEIMGIKYAFNDNHCICDIMDVKKKNPYNI